MNTLDREQWLTEAANMILQDHIEPHFLPDYTVKYPFKVAIGFPSGKPSKVIAECWKAEASAAGVNEIFVSPAIDDSLKVLGALTHELVHYTDNCVSGHKNHFARLARAVGLEGPLTACLPSEALNEELKEIIDILGPLPHAKIDISKRGKKKQGTRMIKLECQNSACEFSYRTSQKQLAKLTFEESSGATECPACLQLTMQTV